MMSDDSPPSCSQTSRAIAAGAVPHFPRTPSPHYMRDERQREQQRATSQKTLATRHHYPPQVRTLAARRAAPDGRLRFCLWSSRGERPVRLGARCVHIPSPDATHRRPHHRRSPPQVEGRMPGAGRAPWKDRPAHTEGQPYSYVPPDTLVMRDNYVAAGGGLEDYHALRHMVGQQKMAMHAGTWGGGN